MNGPWPGEALGDCRPRVELRFSTPNGHAGLPRTEHLAAYWGCNLLAARARGLYPDAVGMIKDFCRGDGRKDGEPFDSCVRLGYGTLRNLIEQAPKTTDPACVEAWRHGRADVCADIVTEIWKRNGRSRSAR